MISVGLLDSGVDGSHPMLQNRIAEMISVDESGQPNHQVCRDPQGHGTHTAGLICAGVSGGTQESSFQLKVVGTKMNHKTILNLHRGLDELLNWDIQIACLPIGIKSKTPIFKPFLDVLIKRGVLVIVPVGNDGDGRFRSPGWYPNVLSVGAVDDRDQPAKFSGSYYDSEGNCLKPDVLAPGVDMISSLPGNKIGKRSGTSMACAYVAGIAAQLLVEQPTLSAEAITEVLISHSTDIPELPGHHYNFHRPIIRSGQGEHLIKPSSSKQHQVSEPSRQDLYIDPFFIRKYECAEPNQELEAILMLDDPLYLESLRTKEGMVILDMFKHVAAVHVIGSKSFFSEIMIAPEITMISAVEVDLFHGI